MDDFKLRVTSESIFHTRIL